MQDLLDLIREPPVENFETWFISIAELLMSNYVIETSNGKYKLKEIEFYYHSELHVDKTTYGYVKPGTNYSDRILRHKSAQRKTLTWFFHYSGVDIVIGNENNPGGILIRSIESIDRQELFKGPLVVLLELLNQQIPVDGTEQLKLQLVRCMAPLETGKLIRSERIGLGAGDLLKKAYNFSIAK